MSMILTAYNVLKPLPPEGSEEWLAMLPGWTGWKYHYGEGGDSNLVYTITWPATGLFLHSVYYDDVHVIGDTDGSVHDGICMANDIPLSYIGDYLVITPCEEALRPNLPKYYIKDVVARLSSTNSLGGTNAYWAVAGVDSLTLE